MLKSPYVLVRHCSLDPPSLLHVSTISHYITIIFPWYLQRRPGFFPGFSHHFTARCHSSVVPTCWALSASVLSARPPPPIRPRPVRRRVPREVHPHVNHSGHYCYPLVNIQKAMENGPFIVSFPWKWWISRVFCMLIRGYKFVPP